MNSALYTGWIRHRRLRPRAHSFRYRVCMLYLDLAELDQVFAQRWFWSTRRPALMRFKRSDYLGDPARPLDDCVREHIERAIGRRPQGPIRLLTHLRSFGYGFNPISIYYCFDEHEQLTALLAEVTNTPWGERRHYVLDANACAGRLRFRFAKTLHVSPFMPLALEYDWRCNNPAQTLAVHMNVVQHETKLFDATLTLRREPISAPSLARALIRFPWISGKIILAIYWEALRLWLKRLPVYSHAPTLVPVEKSES